MSYRNSHMGVGKGSSYQKSFSRIKQRALMWKFEKKCINKIISDFFPAGVTTHLDFACGTGRILHIVERRSQVSHGLDISDEMLSEAAKLCKSQLYRGDLTTENILNQENYDLITAFRFFPNAEEDLRRDVFRKLTDKMHRDTIFIFNNHRNTDSIISRFYGFIFGKNYKGWRHRDVENICQVNGLQIVSCSTYGLLPDSYESKLFPTPLMQLLEYTLGSVLKIELYGFNVIYACRKI